MSISTEEANRLQASASTPNAIVAAINARLAAIAPMVEYLFAMTGETLNESIPETVTLQNATHNGVEYDANGVTLPRDDGAVRVKAWDDFIAKALESDNPATARWAAERAEQPWILIQDTLQRPGLPDRARLSLGYNCSNARMMNGFAGKGFAFWPAFELKKNEQGYLRLGDAIPDAFAVNDDLVFPSGAVRSRGFWISDLPRLAQKSLDYYLLTSGRATQPMPAVWPVLPK